MHDITDEERENLSGVKLAFVDSVECMGQGYVVEMFKPNGAGSPRPSVRAEDQREMMDILAGLADDGVDLREVRFDSYGRSSYIVYVR